MKTLLSWTLALVAGAVFAEGSLTIDGNYAVAAAGESYDSITIAPGSVVTGGVLKINAGGTLTFTGKGVPGTLPDIVNNAKFHFDPSQAGTVALEGTSRYGFPTVSAWKDVRGGNYKTASTYTTAGATAPCLADDCFAGLACMDMSVHGATTYWSGPMLKFEDTLVREFYMVVADADGGYAPFLSQWGSGNYQRGGAAFGNQWTHASITNGVIEVDGVSKVYTDSFPAGFHVLRMSFAGGLTANTFATLNSNAFGTKKFGEVIAFDTVRDAAQVTGITDYLMKKWQGAKVQSLALESGATVSLADGARGLVGQIKLLDTAASGAAVTVNVAAGSVFQARRMRADSAAVNINQSGAGELILPNGDVAQTITAAGTASATSGGWNGEIAAPSAVNNATMHLDASATNSLVFTGSSYCSYPTVSRWNDVRGSGRPYFYQDGTVGSAKAYPFLSGYDVPGRTVMDFGNGSYGAAMYASVTLSIRDVFMVVANDPAAMAFLGQKGSVTDWQRGNRNLTWTWTHASISGGIFEIDGESKTKDDEFPAGFHVLRMRLSANLYADALAYYVNNGGKLKFGEIITFDSAQTDANAKAITAYLLAKWRTASLKSVTLADGASLKADEGARVAVGTLAASGSAAVAVAAGAQVAAADCAGTAALAKTGAGTLSLGDGAGTLAVNAGKAELVNERTMTRVPAIAASAAAHFDASAAGSIVYSGATAHDCPCVSQWKDVRGTNYCYAATSAQNGAQAPWVAQDKFIGLPYMDFSVPGATTCWSGPTLVFNKSISVREFFMVVAEGEGGKLPFLNDWANGNWQRSGTAFWNAWSSTYLKNAFAEVDGVATNEFPTSGFHVLHLRLSGALAANSIATYNQNMFGTKKYAEILIFTSAITDAQAGEITDYLSKKWKEKSSAELAQIASCSETIVADAAAASVSVASNATFAAAAGGVYAKVNAVGTPAAGIFAAEEGSVLALPTGATVGCIAGKGTFAAESFTTAGLAFSSATELPVRATGTLALGTGALFDLSALEATTAEGGAVTLATATSVTGGPWRFKAGVNGLYWKVAPSADGKSLVAKLVRGGMCIIIL